MNEQTIKCPYCTEEISKDAKKCKHCGEFLNAGDTKQTIIEKKRLTGLNLFLYTIAGLIILIVLALVISSIIDY